MVWDDTGTADYLVRWTMWMLQEHPWRLLLGSTWSSWSRSHSPLACSTGPGGVERSDDVAAARGLFWSALAQLPRDLDRFASDHELRGLQEYLVLRGADLRHDPDGQVHSGHGGSVPDSILAGS